MLITSWITPISPSYAPATIELIAGRGIARKQILLRDEPAALILDQMYAHAIRAVFGESIKLARCCDGISEIAGLADKYRFMVCAAHIVFVLHCSPGNKKNRTQRFEARSQRPSMEIVLLSRLARERNPSVGCDALLQVRSTAPCYAQ